jgi:hypothetical protein
MAGPDKEEFTPLLQIGIHNMDVPAVRRLCADRFPQSLSRPRIMSNLEQLIDKINHSAIAGALWVDGSFLTEKLNPDDADIVFVISRAIYRAMTPVQRQFWGWYKQNNFYDSHRVHNHWTVLDPNDASGEYMYAYWLRQFGFSRADEIKGIASVSVPFVVRP